MLSGSPARPELGLTGVGYDRSTGCYQFRFRWHDPERGRWMTEEPSAWDGPNLYHFVFGNPSNFLDPTGLGTTSGGPPNPNQGPEFDGYQKAIDANKPGDLENPTRGRNHTKTAKIIEENMTNEAEESLAEIRAAKTAGGFFKDVRGFISLDLIYDIPMMAFIGAVLDGTPVGAGSEIHFDPPPFPLLIIGQDPCPIEAPAESTSVHDWTLYP